MVRRERISDRTWDVRQAIHVAELCGTKEEVDRFEGGASGRLYDSKAFLQPPAVIESSQQNLVD